MEGIGYLGLISICRNATYQIVVDLGKVAPPVLPKPPLAYKPAG